MALKLANNAVSKLASSLAAGATSLAVMPGDGAKFPALSAGDWFPLTVVKSDGSLEIMRATARASDTLTVSRAQEGTASIAFNAGDRVELRMTALTMNSLPYLPFVNGKTGSVMTIDTNALNADSSFKLDGPATSLKYLAFLVAGSFRWMLHSNIEPESGGNAGSNFAIARYADNGSYIDNPFQIDRKTGVAAFSVRPFFGSHVPWDDGNFNPSSKLDAGARAVSASKLYTNGGGDGTFNWSGQGGQPNWLWGGNDPANMYLYNPSNFSVNYANSAGSAGSVGGVSNPSPAGARVQWDSGVVNFGVISSLNGSLPAPYVVAGLAGPGNGTANAITVYGVLLRNN